MIIWIASYPKSGNTWLRALISAYLYSEDGIFNFNLLKNIQQFPSKKYLDYFLKDFSDIKKVSYFWIAAQNKINLQDKTIFLKTHSALCSLENNSFTDKINTKAAIYMVRDPRNVVTSLCNHYDMNINESFKFISDKNKIISVDKWGGDDFGVSTVLGDWSENYKSWKNLKFAPVIIIKYEDLINKPRETFLSVLIFLNKFMKIKINEKKLSNVVNSCDFDILSKKEDTEHFSESVKSTKTEKKIKFFNLGKKNSWKNLLDIEIEKKIRKLYSLEMKELGYLN